MHVVEAAGFAIAQDDAALIDRRVRSPLLPVLRAPARIVATLLSLARPRAPHASHPRPRLDRAR